MASAASPTNDLIAGLHKKAKRALAENLAEGEKVLVVVGSGKHGAMIGTDRRVFVFKTGYQYGATFGSKFASYEYRNISGIQVESNALGGGFAAVDVAGAEPVRRTHAAKAPNAIFVKKNDKDQKAIADLRRLIADSHQRESAKPTPESPFSQEIVTQITQLGELRDKGLLTPEEFEAKKADLLHRL